MTDTPPKASDYFRRMAERIDLNAAEDFAGAVVAIAPDGKVIELLMLDKERPLAQFWGTLGSRVKMIVTELEEQDRARQGYR